MKIRKLSIIIPVYNERNTIVELLNRVLAVNLINGISKEIIVVDDGGTDGSYSLVKEYFRGKVLLLRHDKNIGKGMAIRTGIEHMTGDVMVIQDADMEYDPIYFNLMLSEMMQSQSNEPQSEQIAVVYGSRRLGERTRRYNHATFFYGGIILNWITNILYGTKLTDSSTCYKMVRREVLDEIGELECRRFEFCPEFTAQVSLLGYKIHEVPISYHPRSKSEGKHIRFRDGLQAAWTLLKYRFWTPKNIEPNKEVTL